jgi:hypothetical protein
MQIMHNLFAKKLKPGCLKYVIILVIYSHFGALDGLIWEQGVGGSNPSAPTSKINYLNRPSGRFTS